MTTLTIVIVGVTLVLAYYTSWREDLIAKTILRSETDNRMYKALELGNRLVYAGILK